MCVFPLIPWRKYDSQRPLFGGDFLGLILAAPSLPGTLFTPDQRRIQKESKASEKRSIYEVHVDSFLTLVDSCRFLWNPGGGYLAGALSVCDVSLILHQLAWSASDVESLPASCETLAGPDWCLLDRTARLAYFSPSPATLQAG